MTNTTRNTTTPAGNTTPGKPQPTRHNGQHYQAQHERAEADAEARRLIEMQRGISGHAPPSQHTTPPAHASSAPAAAKPAPTQSKLDAALATIDAATEAAKANRFNLLKPSEMAAQVGPLKWLIKKVIPLIGIAYLIAPPSSYKSFIAISWAFCIATGRPWAGRKVTRGRVLYVVGEGQAGMPNRLRAICQDAGMQMAELDGWVDFVPQPVNLYSGDVVKLLAELEEKLGRKPEYSLVIFDTLHSCSAGANENDNGDAGVIVDWARMLCREIGAAALLIHHTGHGDKSRGRGASGHNAAADAEFVITKDEDGTLILGDTKFKDGVARGDSSFEILPRVIEIRHAVNAVNSVNNEPRLQGDSDRRKDTERTEYYGDVISAHYGDVILDEDGEAVTSVVVDFTAADVLQTSKLSDTAKAVLSAIQSEPRGLSMSELKNSLADYVKDSTGKEPSRQNLHNKARRALDELIKAALVRDSLGVFHAQIGGRDNPRNAEEAERSCQEF
jgi:hypothetical protein